MQCSSCGTVLLPDASTCPNCGAPVIALQPTLTPQPTLAANPEKTPSFYDEYIPFTDQETPPIVSSPAPPIAPFSDSLAPTGESAVQMTGSEGTFPSSPVTLFPVPPPRRSPLLILTTTISILSLLVIIVLVFLLVRNVMDTNRVAQTPANQFATSDPASIYTQATSKVPLVSDAFSGTTGSSWTATSGNCVVSGVSLHATSAQGSNILCGLKALTVTNFACQVQITLTQGDTVGLVFRANQTSLQTYVIEITSQGSYLLGTGQSGTTNFKVLAEGSNSAINAGHNVANLLTVIALGNVIYFYVNKQFIISTSDSSSRSGLIGLAGSGVITNVAVDATFNHLQVWKL